MFDFFKDNENEMVEDSVYDLLITAYRSFWGQPERQLKLEAHLAMMGEDDSQAVLRYRRQCARQTLEALLQVP